MESVMESTDELLKLARTDAPLWNRSLGGDWDVLNDEEYVKMKPADLFRRKHEGYFTDASKKTCTLMIDPSSVVSILMNSDKWAETFPSMVKKASTIGVLSSELKMMAAELQVLSPLVPVRKVEFHRYCKRHDDGVWTVVDTPKQTFLEDSFAVPDYERLVSGCVVEDMPHGHSKVIWVEHVRYGEYAIHHLYRVLIEDCMAFGAPRWIATFRRQLHRNILQESSGVPIGNDTVMAANARRYLLKLAEHMMKAFCAVVCPSSAPYIDKNLRITTRASMVDSGEPAGTLVSIGTSLKLMQSPQSLFDFLREENIRKQWGLANVTLLKEYHIATGEDGNFVSLLRSVIEGQSWVLQETCRDELGALVVMMPIDYVTVDIVLTSGDISNIPLVLSGFAIEPDEIPPLAPHMKRSPFHDAEASLLTIFKQDFRGHLDIVTSESMKNYGKLMARNVESIKKGLHL